MTTQQPVRGDRASTQSAATFTIRAGVSAPAELYWMLNPLLPLALAPYGWQTDELASRVRARALSAFRFEWDDEGTSKSASRLDVLGLAVATGTYEDDSCERLAERIACGGWSEAPLRTESWRDRVVAQRRMGRLASNAWRACSDSRRALSVAT